MRDSYRILSPLIDNIIIPHWKTKNNKIIIIINANSCPKKLKFDNRDVKKREKIPVASLSITT